MLNISLRTSPKNISFPLLRGDTPIGKVVEENKSPTNSLKSTNSIS
jgi:hypothetical protein